MRLQFIFIWVSFLLAPSLSYGQSIDDVVRELSSTRAIFDDVFFEYEETPYYDEDALKNNWGSTASRVVRKIARQGELRYCENFDFPMPFATIKYAPSSETVVWDGQKTTIRREKSFRVQNIKSSASESNTVFFALCWPESTNELIRPDGKPATRIFFPELLADSSWTVSDSEVIDEIDCVVVISKKFGMKLWFARKYGMMPVRFFFEKSSIFPLEKLTEFTDYKPIGDSGIYFPRKIVSKSKLYSKDSPNYEGTSEISISINSIELNPAPSVFSHFPVPGELVIDISKKTTYVHYPDSNLFFENGIMEAQQRLRLSVSTSSFSTHWAIGSFLLTCFIVCLIVFIRRRASIA